MLSIADEKWFHSPELTQLLRLLNTQGGTARIVGGAIRDSLMNLEVKDIDIATTLSPKDVMQRAQKAGLKAIPIGISHGTVKVFSHKRIFDVTTLRNDLVTDGRHAQVVFIDDWSIDAHRRDFTINALYADCDGRIIDLVNGLADIQTRTVRFIGNADERISEDYLRILRFFRFFAHYGGKRPDFVGLRAAIRAKNNLKKLSAERIWLEMKKLLEAANPVQSIFWMCRSGIAENIIPESRSFLIKDHLIRLIAEEHKFGWQPDPLLRLAAIIPSHDVVRVTELAKRLRFSSKEKVYLFLCQQPVTITQNTSITELNKLLYQHGKHVIAAKLKIFLATTAVPLNDKDKARIIFLLEETLKWVKPVFPLKGSDILAFGILPGKKVGESLSFLTEVWIDSNFQLSREDLLKYAHDFNIFKR
ncbi:CCA tRNA nucleotidyltransferase [Liberibacter crescens]|nr:CCA tRNA nucleotidyltransferase [Liberibacter crescens]AMC13358.1 hypothetical protein RL73_03615 [Liberibacter crescens]